MPSGARGKDKLVYKISSVELTFCAHQSEITVATKQVGTSKKCEQRAVIKRQMGYFPHSAYSLDIAPSDFCSDGQKSIC